MVFEFEKEVVDEMEVKTEEWREENKGVVINKRVLFGWKRNF